MSKISEVGPYERKLTVTIDAEALAEGRRLAAARLSQDKKIKGFRPGKAPMKVVESVIGTEALDQEAIEDALPKALADAINETDLRPVVYPRLVDIRPLDGTAEVDVIITLWPTPKKLPKYDGRKVTVERPFVSDTDIDNQVDRMRDQFAELDEVSREGFDGDFMLLDLKTTVDGEDLAAGSANDLMYEIGSGQMFPELDDALRGVAAGGIVTFDSTLPESIGPEGGRTASVRALVKRVHTKRLPELTDDWVADVTEFETIDAMRAEVRREIQEIFDRNVWTRLEQTLIAELAEDLTLDLPEALVTAEMESIFHRFAHRLEQQGVDVEQYLQLTGQTSEAFSDDLRSQAEANLRTRILLESIADKEGITVDDDEVDREVALLAQMAGATPDEYRNALEEGGHVTTLTGDILRRKAVDRLLELAKPVGDDGKPIELPERTVAEDPEPLEVAPVASADEDETEVTDDRENGEPEA